MQLALTPEVLVPVGAGAVLLVIALVVVVLLVRRRRRTRAQDRPTVADAVRETTEPVPAADGPVDRPDVDPTERVGSGRTVAAAVAQALAVREARARVAAADAPPAPVTAEPAAPMTAAIAAAAPATTGTPAEPAAEDIRPAPAEVRPPTGRGDARDRLLAVLLDDPVRAVGATVELDACRRQLERLTDAVRHEHETLRSVLTRLADAGLAHDQLARLSGLSDDELRGLLTAPVGVG